MSVAGLLLRGDIVGVPSDRVPAPHFHIADCPRGGFVGGGAGCACLFTTELWRASSLPGDLSNLKRQLLLKLTLQNWN